MTKRILLIDDDAAFLRATKTYLEANGYDCFAENNFKRASAIIHKQDFSVIITDYKDVTGGVADAGNKILKKLKTTSFTPLIIYTGFENSIPVDIVNKQNSFFKIVEKGVTSEGRLLECLNTIFTSKEFLIKEEIENELQASTKESFREYFWNIVNNHWSEFEIINKATLKKILERKILKNVYPIYIDGDNINPIEFYEHPMPSHTAISTGLILEKKHHYYICINNDCDMTLRKKTAGVEWTCKAKYLYFFEIKDHSSFLKSGVTEKVKAFNSRIINNNSDHQESKYFFPKTFYFAGGYVDYGDIITVPIVIDNDKISLRLVGKPIAKIHAPFLHRFISNFSKFYSRFGTPDITVA